MAFLHSISQKDIRASVIFLIMTFVILPLLPDRPIDSMGLINLYRIWYMVVLVAGISFFGYIAIRLLGSTHGIGLAGLFGGLVSSTAVAMSMAKKAYENGFLMKNLALGIALASSMMLIRAGVEMWVINPLLAKQFFIPICAGSFAGFIYIGYLYRTTKKENIPQNIEFTNPFDLKEALLMGMIFGLILALITLSERYVGDMGVYAVALISGVADVDAIILSLSSLAKKGLDPTTAQYGVIIAIVSNSFTKSILVLYFGKTALFRLIGIYYLISVGTFAVLAAYMISAN